MRDSVKTRCWHRRPISLRVAGTLNEVKGQISTQRPDTERISLYQWEKCSRQLTVFHAAAAQIPSLPASPGKALECFLKNHSSAF
jgi:hypothetical protein